MGPSRRSRRQLRWRFAAASLGICGLFSTLLGSACMVYVLGRWMLVGLISPDQWGVTLGLLVSGFAASWAADDMRAYPHFWTRPFDQWEEG